MGANEPLLERERTLSSPKLTNGSGSDGRETGLSSVFDGLCGLLTSASLKVTLGGACCLCALVHVSPIASSSISGAESTSFMITSLSDASFNLRLAVASTCCRTLGGQRFQKSSSTSPVMIRHSTEETDRTVAVRRSASARLTTSPKY